MANYDEVVREFVAVTDIDEERARFFLESAGWDLQLALASFYEDGADDDIVTIPQPGAASVSHPPGPRTQSRVTSFRDLVQNEEEEGGDEEGQRFYAGGSERSGQQIVGPPKKKSSNEMVENLFKRAKQHGAVPVERVGWGSEEPSGSRLFGGGGYRLGAAPEESAYIAGAKLRGDPTQEVHMVLKLWKSGFSLDNGELRSYSDSGNAIFLESVRRGEIPQELRQLSQGGIVNLDMEDHRDTEFAKPKSAFKAFCGEGQKLGCSAPTMGPPTGLLEGLQDQVDRESKASTDVDLDDTKPVTSIQIRLADGSRLVQKFNHSHSVSDVRQFVASACPAMASIEFVLMTTFPNMELTDESQTLKDAGLLNAVIVQRLK